MMKTVALAGNPNVGGKTTLFNALTGMRQHVGNWPGVTVEKKEGVMEYRGEKFLVVDLPGTYSLTAHSLDELVARDFLLNGNADVVVDVVDATALMRNLFLTMEILEMGGLKNVIIALNKMDLAEKRGIKIDVKRMEEVLGGVPVVPLNAKDGVGIDELKEKISRMASGLIKTRPVVPTYDKEVEREIEHITMVLESTSLAEKYHLRWLAIKLLQRDDGVMKLVLRHLGKEKLDEILGHISEVEERYKRAMDLVIASQKYEFIDNLMHRFIKYPPPAGGGDLQRQTRQVFNPPRLRSPGAVCDILRRLQVRVCDWTSPPAGWTMSSLPSASGWRPTSPTRCSGGV